MEKSKIIYALKERLDSLEEWRAEKKKPEDKKKPGAKKEDVDEEVCPVCGGNLQFVEVGIVFCPKCNQYFEFEEED